MAEEIEKVKCLIIGSGPAGYTAAIYASRANMFPLLYQGEQPGGQLTTTTEVENWPAGHAELQGPELMQDFLSHAERFNVEIIYDHIHTANVKDKPIHLD